MNTLFEIIEEIFKDLITQAKLLGQTEAAEKFRLILEKVKAVKEEIKK